MRFFATVTEIKTWWPISESSRHFSSTLMLSRTLSVTMYIYSLPYDSCDRSVADYYYYYDDFMIFLCERASVGVLVAVCWLLLMVIIIILHLVHACKMIFQTRQNARKKHAYTFRICAQIQCDYVL